MEINSVLELLLKRSTFKSPTIIINRFSANSSNKLSRKSKDNKLLHFYEQQYEAIREDFDLTLKFNKVMKFNLIRFYKF